ncbi:hypothetical protein GCM10023333_13110 [Ferrimonas pelagia]|uniref:Uncharacterized protein n=1 Tax=Ferrimonas pelagia TaxID=1177826 RepID=A0ABP9ELX3_9GAMM
MIQDLDQVQISLLLPTDSLWGFERAPANDEEEALIRRVLGQLSAGHRFFALSGRAQCQPQDVEIIPPQGLDTPGYSGHMELEAHWRWQCEQVTDLNQVKVEFFKHYPQLHKLTAQRLTLNGSGGATLTPQHPTMSW